MGEMRRAIAQEERQRQKQDRFASSLIVAASVVAAIRLAREPEMMASPRLVPVVNDSISLARMILDRIVR
jgi:hypothetical protein